MTGTELAFVLATSPVVGVLLYGTWRFYVPESGRTGRMAQDVRARAARLLDGLGDGTRAGGAAAAA